MRHVKDPEEADHTHVTIQEPLECPQVKSALLPGSPPKKPPEPGTQRYCQCTGRRRKVRSRVTVSREALGLGLGLAAVLFIVTVGLSVYIIVLKGSQSSEQPQTKGAQSEADGKDCDVLFPCGDDWIWYRNKCYYFPEAAGNWTEAKDSCAALNSSLALIDTRKELDFMLRYKGYRGHWIGLQRETDQHWKWVNGTEFSNWFAVEDFAECAYLSHERVKSVECYSKREWICTKVSK